MQVGNSETLQLVFGIGDRSKTLLKEFFVYDGSQNLGSVSALFGDLSKSLNAKTLNSATGSFLVLNNYSTSANHISPSHFESSHLLVSKIIHRLLPKRFLAFKSFRNVSHSISASIPLSFGVSSCPLTILNFNERLLPAVRFSNWTLSRAKGRVAVTSETFPFNRPLFDFGTTDAHSWNPVNLYGTVISILVPAGASFRFDLINPVLITDARPLQNGNAGILMNPHYPDRTTLQGISNWGIGLSESGLKLRITFVDVDLHKNTILKINYRHFDAGDHSGKTFVFDEGIQVFYQRINLTDRGVVIKYEAFKGVSSLLHFNLPILVFILFISGSLRCRSGALFHLIPFYVTGVCKPQNADGNPRSSPSFVNSESAYRIQHGEYGPQDGQLSVRLADRWRPTAIQIADRRRPSNEEEEEDKDNNCIFGNQIRFTIMIISTLCLSSILSNILTFNFTVICMAGEKPENYSAGQTTDLGNYRPDLDYTSAQKSMLFMAVAVGSLLAVFPLTIMLNKFGSRRVFGSLGFISAFSTFLVPLSANMGFYYILFMRIIQGTAFSACLPVMGSITSHWSTLKQNGIFIAILSSFLQVAPIFTMPVSGELCTSSLGWTSVYYLHGCVSVVLFSLFLLYHRNTPHKHPLVQRRELVKVMFGKGSIYSGPGKAKVSKKVPMAAMYKDPAIWAILVAAFGNFMGTQLSLQFMPTYINKVLFLPIEQTGVASAISPSSCSSSRSSPARPPTRSGGLFLSDNIKLRIYNSLSMGGMGVLFIVLAFLNPESQKSLCLIVLIASTCILGFNSGGFFKSSQMVSRQHSHFTLANISFLNCVCMLLTPLLNELIAPQNTPETWAIVLCIHGAILLSTNAFFCVFAQSKPAPWTLETWSNKGSKIAPAEESKASKAPE
ncbi:hypothetical protein L596_008122 [Steinernema carpocapsae]|uniref:Major facilitator superfamily (MFS) profile domain-containing protein n=1 Tax=Steinernema carpocapsae TaxID=34508 RepID=A0A4U5PC18_STECR|nr:hypothetical protein L596_008122 [Steinernema carpocapsae]